MTNSYSLTPFSAHPTSYAVEVSAARQKNVLSLIFTVTDPQHQIIWPHAEPTATHHRQDYLWENTCFEAFIGIKNRSEYFELNLSTQLAWNLYRFTDYRTPNTMPPIAVTEPALLRFEVKDHTLLAEIDLTALKLTNQEIQLGLTAVIKTHDSTEYLSLNHPKSEADFHDARGWTIQLLPETQIPESIVDNKAKDP